MKITSTGRDLQRSEFVDSLYNSLRKKTAAKIDDHKKIISMASSYVSDGLEESECIELLIIENGLSREAATGYVNMVRESSVDNGNGDEYSFQFEDVNGKAWSSHDIGKILTASSESEAWEKAEKIIESIPNIEGDRVTSVSKI
jgi:hypothetical protein